MSDTTRLKSTIFIGGLSQSVSQTTLQTAFIPFGPITEITLPAPDTRSSTQTASNIRPGDTHKGFGYIEFADAEDAAEAIDNMDQAELFGRVIKVAPAKPSQARRDGGANGEGVLGSRTAVWEQEGWLAANATEETMDAVHEGAEGVDPAEGLRGLDVAGPRGE